MGVASFWGEVALCDQTLQVRPGQISPPRAGFPIYSGVFCIFFAAGVLTDGLPRLGPRLNWRGPFYPDMDRMIIEKQLADIPGNTRTPILSYCRKLVRDGADPATQLHVYRDDILALKINSIGVAAKLAVEESRGRPRFVSYKPYQRYEGSAAGALNLVGAI